MKTGRLVSRTEFEKAAALGVDLRQKGLGGVKRPSFETEDSKQHAFSMLKNTQDVGKFNNMTKPSTLVKPGPSIKQVSTLPPV
jgi:hypothetical protein